MTKGKKHGLFGIQQVYRKRGVSGQAALVRQVLAADALPRRRKPASRQRFACSCCLDPPSWPGLDTFEIEEFTEFPVPGLI